MFKWDVLRYGKIIINLNLLASIYFHILEKPVIFLPCLPSDEEDEMYQDGGAPGLRLLHGEERMQDTQGSVSGVAETWRPESLRIPSGSGSS